MKNIRGYCESTIVVEINGCPHRLTKSEAMALRAILASMLDGECSDPPAVGPISWTGPGPRPFSSYGFMGATSEGPKK